MDKVRIITSNDTYSITNIIGEKAMAKNDCLVVGPRYVALGVKNFDEALTFYRDIWKLEVVSGGPGVAYLAAPSDIEPFIIRLRASDEKRMDLAAFSCATRADVDTLADRLTVSGVEIIAPPAELDQPGGGYGFRFFDCDGRVIEMSADVTPHTPAKGSEPGLPLALSHIVFNSDDLEKTLDFYSNKVGMRLSDRLVNIMCFVRGSTTRHHIMAVALGPHHAVNHISFEMGTIDSLMRGAGRVKRTGRKILWGPGRHGAGDNVFTYFTDPAGNVCEMSCELEEVPETDWKIRVFGLEETEQDSWGVSETVAMDLLGSGLIRATR